jgi:hypothetical protein
MLLGGKQSEIKQVAIVTRNQKFNRLLGSILADWKFFVVDDLQAAKVAFVERGVAISGFSGELVILSPMPLQEESFLLTPISLTRLYHLLEVYFFPTPRRHIRVASETNTGINVGDGWQDCKLLSFSDRGGRLVCQQEIPRGTQIQVETKLGDHLFQVPAEVLYCVPAGDAPGRSKPQVGVLFKPADENIINMLRRYIEKISVESACAREDISLNDPCLSWIDVPDNPWDEEK